MEVMHSSLESDRNARRRIVSEIGTNFFVEAGAGSGKTTMLVRRMVAMVEAGVPISKICAITFTRAAAGEFYNRFQKMLMDRSNPDMRWETGEEAGQLPVPTAETRERCHEALQNIDLCFMGTIDSFCGMLLSEHPTEAGVPSDATILSDEDAETIYRQQYVKICGGQYGEELQQLAKTFQLLHRNAQDVFQQGLSFLMNNRNVRFHYDERSNVRIDQQFAGERKQLLAAIRFLMDHPNLKYPREQKNLKAWENLPGSFQNIRGRWSSNFGNVLYGLKELKNLRVLPGAVQENDDMLEPLFVPGGKKGDWYELRAAQEGGLLDQLKKLQYDVSMTFMTRCIPILEQALREKSGLTYFDFLYYLRNMLRKDAEKDGKLIRYIYNRHSYFLIDEFQDTNPLQAEVFFYLSAENPVPQWSACVPRPGSLFIVGDPKQSIYRFRSADVTSFLRVKRLFERSGGAVLALSRNFRSVSTLSEYYNYRNGISFENDEATVLLAVLKECFKDGGEGISLDQFPEALPDLNKPGQVRFVLEEESADSSGDDPLLEFLSSENIDFVDKRSKGGALWIVGGHELDDLMVKCGEKGYKFFYSEKGGRVTKYAPAWYLRTKRTEE